MPPRSRFQWLIVLLLLIAGLALCGVAALPFAAVRGWVDQYAGDGSADPYTPALHSRLQLALMSVGLVCLALAVFAYMHRTASGVFDRLRTDSRDLRLQLRALTGRLGSALIAVTALAALLRSPYLGQPMRYDESYTYLNYAGRPLVVLLATYEDPNNHVLHSLLVHLATRLFGNGPWAIRLPAFAAGVLIAPATMLLARLAAGRLAAWYAGLMAAASSPLIEYSTNARGYTLVVLLTILAWLLASLAVRRENRLVWWLLGGVLALGAWTIPVMLYPAAMLVVWIALQGLRAERARRRQLFSGLIVTVAGAGLLTLLLYMPILLVAGPRSLAGNQFVAPRTWPGYMQGLRAAAVDTWRLLLRDVSGPSLALLALGALAALLPRRGIAQFPITSAIATILICFLLTTIQRVLPPARVWLFLVPLGMVVVAAGLARMSTAVQGAPRQLAIAVTVLLTAVWPAANCWRHESVLRSEETGACPDAQEIVEWLAGTLQPHEPILSAAPTSSPLVYYADRLGLSRDHFAPLDTFAEPIGPAVAVVSRTYPQSLDDILEALHAPPDMSADSFKPVEKFPSATVYRRSGAGSHPSNP